METRVIPVDREHLQSEDFAEAAQLLRDGELVAFPTETVYGLGGDALDPDASRRIYAAKGRPSDNPRRRFRRAHGSWRTGFGRGR